MRDFKEIIEKDSNTLVVLKKTKRLEESDLLNKKWKWMWKQYDGCENEKDSTAKTCISIVNSILYQNRRYFCLTRENVERIIRNDENWKSKVGYSNESYRHIIRFLTKNEFIQDIPYHGYTSKKPKMFKVIDVELLEFISANEKDQEKELADFLTHKNLKLPPKIAALYFNCSYVFIGERVEFFQTYMKQNVKLHFPIQDAEICKMANKCNEFEEKEYYLRKEGKALDKSTEEEWTKLAKDLDQAGDSILAMEYFEHQELYAKLKEATAEDYEKFELKKWKKTR